MFNIEKNVLEKNLYYKNHLILKYSIEYPKIVGNSYSYAIQKFNHFYQMKAIELKLYAEKDLFDNAKQVFDYNEKNNFPFFNYELISNYTITYNKDSIISLFSDIYTFTGGAHGNTERVSQTWNMKTGNLISLCTILNHDCSSFLLILKEILHQIQTQISNCSNYYFEDYASLIIENFNFEQFYLIDNNLAIFYQQYDIAPYSSGIPVFLIDMNIYNT